MFTISHWLALVLKIRLSKVNKHTTQPKHYMHSVLHMLFQCCKIKWIRERESAACVFKVAFAVFIWSGVSDRLVGVLQVL